MITELMKAFRTDENTVKVLYLHNELHQEFIIEWCNIHPETAEVNSYDLQINCLGNSENLNELVETAIREGETDNNKNLKLYLEIRDTFDNLDCKNLKEN